MKYWSETIQFNALLKDASILSVTTLEAEREKNLQEQLLKSYERGRDDGIRSMSEQLAQQKADIEELAAGAVAALKSAVPQVVRETENAMVGLTIEIAQKLVSELPVSVEMIEGAVREAMEQVEGNAQFYVRLNPTDFEMLQKSGSMLLAPSQDGGEIRFSASTEVTRGGCLVQTRFGILDARRETKLDLLKRSLLT